MNTVLDLIYNYDDLTEQSVVVVGVNDFQQAPKDIPIYEETTNADCIVGLIDMGDNHAMFKYNKDLAGQTAWIVDGLDADDVKSVKFCLPKDSHENKISKEYKAWFSFIQKKLKQKGIASDYTLRSVAKDVSGEIVPFRSAS